ncbi:MAG: hypothetical protein HQM02_03255 [Magnetococcales bacterium]|nr:hypothetical protein [Magnetococcales bacterium]
MALVAPESVSIQRLVMDGRISKEATAFSSAYASPTRSRGDLQTTATRGDLVDISGLEAIGEAIRQYRGQEALPIPESVGKAIRSLVQEVLDGLPRGGGFFAF